MTFEPTPKIPLLLAAVLSSDEASTCSGVGLPHALALAVVLVASLVAGDAATGATTAPTFARADYELFGNNYDVGDFNGDGSLDLAGAGGPAAKVRLNNGAGTFGVLAEYPVGGGNTQDLAAGDFNGDGRLDRPSVGRPRRRGRRRRRSTLRWLGQASNAAAWAQRAPTDLSGT